MNIDKWSAEQVGVEIHTGYWIHNRVKHDFPWSVLHPVCREIVRERFKINTSYIDKDKWRSVEMKWRRKEPDHTGSYCLSATGKNIAEAEIACITTIYEAQKR